MMSRIITLVLLGVMSAGINNCSKKVQSTKISLEKRESLPAKHRQSREIPLRIAVGSMITPREGFIYYKQLLDYLGEKLDQPVLFIERKNYAETNAMIKSGDIDISFVCGRPYVDGHDEFGMELLVAPRMYGETVYYSYIIVAKDSPSESFEDLRGSSFAFTDSMSNSGKLVPTYLLARMGETPDTYFQRYIFTNAHDKSIKAVAQGIVDGAAVDHLIWEYANRTNPEFTSKTKVIHKSLPYGIPPVVASPGLEPELKERIRQIFLATHEDEKGREILKAMMIEQFVVIDDSLYDSIREMKSWIARQQGRE